MQRFITGYEEPRSRNPSGARPAAASSMLEAYAGSMKNVTIIDGHPDPSLERLNHALADRYAREVEEAGCDVRRIDVAQLDVPLLRTEDDYMRGSPSETIAQAQRDIAWADHLVVFYPMWMFMVPAVLKAFVEQVFRPTFALPRGKTARIVVTMGMPAPIYRVVFGEHGLKSLKQGLRFLGFRSVTTTLIGSVETASTQTHQQWFARVARLARHDVRARVGRAAATVLGAAVAVGAVTSAASYLALAAATWSRYGRPNRHGEPDSHLDRVMPDYEVRLDHHIEIDAPAELAFAAICRSDFSRSPVIRALFRAREIVMHAKHQESGAPAPHTIVEQFTSFGWSIVSEEQSREIVFGTVTKPWEPNPVMRPLAADAFARFAEPGYARIAFTIRVEELTPSKCIARTETRVQTTDEASRAKFRMYWAFLSPGMTLIRMALLQQMKSEAEASWRALRIGV